MYNPSRGGVRGGADQFSWDSVKNDKHRENYLGHSLMAPIGRWQKGKDLTWYDKKRNDSQEVVKRDKLELQEIKKAEQEAMLIALGHSVVQRDTQRLTKEEMKEAFKRNSGERDALNIERIDGVGVSSARTALMMGGSKQARNRNEGVTFENHPQDINESQQQIKETRDTPCTKKKKFKKSSKKHKKQKKSKKSHKRSSDSFDESDSAHQISHKHSRTESDIREYSSKKIKHENKHYSTNYSDSDNSIQSKPKHSKKRREKHKTSNPLKKRRHDTSESDS